MRLLAIETATDACSVALHWDGQVSHLHRVAARAHAAQVLPAVTRLLAAAGARTADLDAIAFGRGPGSFTGVRIAAAVCQGLAFGADLPVVPVSTLASMAQGAYRRHGWRRVLVALDARMAEVYFAAFVVGVGEQAEPLAAETLCAPEAVPVLCGEVWGAAGSAWDVYEPVLRARYGAARLSLDAQSLPDARDTLVLGAAALAAGEAVAAELALPVYLRDRVTRPRAVD